MLADEEMTVGGIHEELRRRGEEKAETTVRHHVDVLLSADMVEIARLEEARGETRKYYKSNTRVFSYDLSKGGDEALGAARATAADELRSLVETLYAEHGDDIEAVARDAEALRVLRDAALRGVRPPRAARPRAHRIGRGRDTGGVALPRRLSGA